MRKGHFMKDRENFFKEIRLKLFNGDNTSELSNLIYLIEEHLKSLTLKDIKETQEWIDETIDMYYSDILNDAIKEAENTFEYYQDENGHYIEHNKYMKQVWYDRYEPNVDLIIEDFNVEIRYMDNDSNIIEWLLEIGYRDTGLIDEMENYQIMAIMALEYIERFINSNLRNQDAFRAFLAFISAERFKRELEAKEIKTQSKKEMSEKASKSRHKENHRRKEVVISRWKNHLETKTKEGKQASKTSFSQKIFKELEEAHKKDPINNKLYSFKTIRNNWLQGI